MKKGKNQIIIYQPAGAENWVEPIYEDMLLFAHCNGGETTCTLHELKVVVGPVLKMHGFTYKMI